MYLQMVNGFPALSWNLMVKMRKCVNNDNFYKWLRSLELSPGLTSPFFYVNMLLYHALS